MVFTSMACYSQNTITGTVVEEDTSEPLIGVTVRLKGTSLGAVTDVEGAFRIDNVSDGEYTLQINSIGYKPFTEEINVSGDLNLGNLSLGSSSVDLSQVVVTGVIDLVEDRETPVAVSTIRGEEIQLRLGNQEFPEILKTTPSVYTTKTSGGYGDGRISVRGFDNTNVAVIINGQPVNDMENGRVYWSNWAGLQDMASGIEVQRGLGASNLAVPSVGGTINVITKSSNAEKGGYFSQSVGNDGYLKSTIGYNSGKVKEGWSVSAMAGYWKGDGYIDGTAGEGFNYLFGMGYRFNEKHAVNMNFLGAGQWHNQRDTWVSIRDYQTFGDRDDAKDGIYRRFNLDWGMRDGEVFNIRRNFYNKPLGSINWDWDISDKTRLATSLYGSWGRGGGTGPRGRNFDVLPFRRDLTAHLGSEQLSDKYRTSEGYLDYDAIVANNRQTAAYSGDIGFFQGQMIGSNGYSENGVNSNVMVRRSSINSHNWYGGISNLKHEVGDFTLGLGIDLRSYEGLHYRVMNDLMGLDGYYSVGNEYSKGRIVSSTSEASPFKNVSESQKIHYYNIGKVNWSGVNSLIEYNKNNVNAVVQGGISTQNYQRVDYFAQSPQESDDHSITGGYIKGGANYNIDHQQNVFFNAGFIARQPFFDAVFPNFANAINDDVESEEITSLELGYGFRSQYISAKFNGYITSWTNRFISNSVQLPNGAEGTAVYSGIENIHSGVELEVDADPIDNLSLTGMLSIGDWKYSGETTADVFDDNQDLIGSSTLYIDDVKVGDVAQTTYNIGAEYTIIDGLSVDAMYLGYSDLYADFSVLDDEFSEEDNRGALELPSYGLVDLGATYRYQLTDKNNLIFRVNVNNAFDNLYIAESNSNIHDINTNEGYSSYEGISNQNSVWFGFGRTFNGSVRLTF